MGGGPFIRFIELPGIILGFQESKTVSSERTPTKEQGGKAQQLGTHKEWRVKGGASIRVQTGITKDLHSGHTRRLSKRTAEKNISLPSARGVVD